MKTGARLGLLIAVVAAAALAVAWQSDWWRPSAPPEPLVREPAAVKPVGFLPAPGGAHTAWLVAGPFEKPLSAPEKAAAPAEGGALSGKPWKLVASAESLVQLDAKSSGLYYAAGALVAGAAAERDLMLISAGPARVWLNGRLLGATTTNYYRGLDGGDWTAGLKPGTNSILVECAGSSFGTAFQLTLTVKGSDSFRESAPEPMELALSDRSPARMARILAGSLNLAATRPWAEPGKTVDFDLRRSGSAPDFKGELDVKLSLGAGDAAGTSRSFGRLRLLDAPQKFTLTAPDGDYLSLECAAEVRDPASGAQLARKSILLHSRENIDGQAYRVLLAARPAAATGGPAAASAALAALKAEKAMLLLRGQLPGETGARAAIDELSAAAEAMAAAKEGRDALAGQIGWLERAYFCPVDGSVQPYRLYVPGRLADPAERQAGALPMIVYLHGWVPEYDKQKWVEENQMRGFCAAAEAAGAILLFSFGRSNTDFASIGEVDVLRAIDETCRLYPVDRNRVSLCGYSMGGYGAWNVAAHHPDRFAALFALSARPVPYFVERQGRAGQPRYKGFCLDVDCPLALAPNLAGVPQLIFHSPDDFVPIEPVRQLRDRLLALGGQVELREFKGDHWSGYEVMTSPETLAWLVDHRRAERPASVAIRTFSPRNGRNAWVRIDEIDRWTEPAEMRAADDGQGTIRVTAKNVRQFRLDGVPALTRIAGAEGFRLTATAAAPRGEAGLCTVLGRLRAAPAPGRWTKSAALPGPMKEACDGPFVVVWGSAGSARETAENEARAGRFAREWHNFAKGLPRVVDEKDLTAEDKAGRSIILFGSPATSALVREAAPTFECRLTESEFEVAGCRASLAGRGLVLTRPSPWAPNQDRYLVVCTGLFYGEGAAGNHKLDLVPDFIVFGPGSEGEGEPPALLAGFFDSDWKADPKLVEVFEPKPVVE